MAITYFNSASNPADDGSLATDPVAVTPPANMQAGDLVLMIAQQRGTGATLAISQAGGQSWTAEAAQSQTNCTVRLFWCRFNGTWSANPSVDFSGTTCNSVVMHVFRPSNTSKVWAVDVAQVSNNFSAPSSPYTVTIPGINTQTDGAIVFATWATADDNTWGSLTGGWSTPGTTQYRNNAGQDQSQTHAYKVMATAGPSGNVSKNQVDVAGDAGAYLIIAFREENPVFMVDGNVSFSLIPGSSSIADCIAAGAVDFFLIPNSSNEYQAPQRWLIERGQYILNEVITEFGTRVLPYAVDESGVAANTQRQAVSEFIVEGNISLSMVPAANSLAEYVCAGAVILSLTSQAMVTLEWEVQGNVLVSLMPGSTPILEYVMTGAVVASLVPASTSIADYVLTGTVSLSFTPGSPSIFEWSMTGDILIGFTPQAAVTREWIIQGNALLVLTPNSTWAWEVERNGDAVFTLVPVAQSLPDYILTGNIPLAFAPQSAVAPEWVMQGNVGLSFLPGATSIFEWTMTGAMEVTFFPSASYYYEGTMECVGDVVVTIAPEASVIPEYIAAGAVQVLVAPQSQAICEISHAGTINFSLSPQAVITEELVIAAAIEFLLSPNAAVTWDWAAQGDIPLSLLPHAISITEIPIQGDLVFVLSPDAQALVEYSCLGDIPFSLVPHSTAGMGTFEWEIVGDIVLSFILRGVGIFTKPEGQYGYDWDPSKHFFVEGKNYDASLEFGLDKRLPIGESGDYKYDA